MSSKLFQRIASGKWKFGRRRPFPFPSPSALSDLAPKRRSLESIGRPKLGTDGRTDGALRRLTNERPMLNRFCRRTFCVNNEPIRFTWDVLIRALPCVGEVSENHLVVKNLKPLPQGSVCKISPESRIDNCVILDCLI